MEILLGLWLIVNVSWAQKSNSPATLPTGLKAGLKGEYFAGPNFDRKVLTRTDPQVNFNWNWQSPDPNVPREYFSVRWTGRLYAPTSGNYRFSATVDDGVRVWVNGKKVIDEWRKQDDSNFVGEITLSGHRLYDLRIEYYNDWKGSVISVFWESPDDRKVVSFASSPRRPIPANYLFNKPEQPLVTTKPVTRVTLTPIKPVPRQVASKAAMRSVASPVAAGQRANAQRSSVTPSPNKPTTPVAIDQPFASLKTGDVIILKHVLFAQSEYTLLPESYAELDKFLTALKAHPTVRVEVAGHTDNVGDRRLNLTLSEYRAKVVANYLIQHCIAFSRVTYKGYGGSRPVVNNTNETQRAQNRRVECIVLEQ